MTAGETDHRQCFHADSELGVRFSAPDPAQLSAEYKELRRCISRSGLFTPQYGFYARTIVVSWSMLAIGFALLPFTRDHGLYLLDAIFLAFVYGQLGFLGHDGAHGEIFRKWQNNHFFCLLEGNLLMGLSTGWWTQKHNLHHKHPNCITLDGELEIAALAFTEEQALSRTGVLRHLAKYQAYTFFPLLAMTALALRVESVQYILRSRPRYYVMEALLLCVHFALYTYFVFFSLGLLRGVLFILLHQVLFGLYMGCVFAPNHKGMPMLEKGVQLDYVRKQVITARNIKPGVIADFCYGGLNYQIEHHLFPNLPRNRLREARQVIEPFCRERGIPYVIAGTLESYGEILRFLNRISIAVRYADEQRLVSPEKEKQARHGDSKRRGI